MKALARFKKRTGRCYELAGLVMLNDPTTEQLTLIHGRVSQFENGPLTDHAWLARADGSTYDPVLNGPRPTGPGWKAQIAHRYSREEAAHLVTTHGHWGPWTTQP